MKGSVIKGENGHFLAQDYYWFPHDAPEEAWVHAETVLEYLRQHARDWQIKPAEVFPATWSKGKGTTVGPPFPFRFEDHYMKRLSHPSEMDGTYSSAYSRRKKGLRS